MDQQLHQPIYDHTSYTCTIFHLMIVLFWCRFFFFQNIWVESLTCQTVSLENGSRYIFTVVSLNRASQFTTFGTINVISTKMCCVFLSCWRISMELFWWYQKSFVALQSDLSFLNHDESAYNSLFLLIVDGNNLFFDSKYNWADNSTLVTKRQIKLNANVRSQTIRGVVCSEHMHPSVVDKLYKLIVCYARKEKKKTFAQYIYATSNILMLFVWSQFDRDDSLSVLCFHNREYSILHYSCDRPFKVFDFSF